MAEILGQAPAKGTNAQRAESSLPQSQTTAAYDGQNAGVQQQRSAESLLAAARVRRGGNWFYFIAGLSVVNTVAALSGGNFHFVLGLGVTQITDALKAPQARSMGFALDVLVLGFFVMCGYFAGKLQKWAFIVGMAFYVLDSSIMLLAKDWLSLAFHAYVLVSIWKGFSSVNAARQTSQVAALAGH
jgi:hypothetical protein